MKMINTFESIKNFFYDKEFELGDWKEYAAQISLELPLKCTNDSKQYNYEKEILPIITSALQNKTHMEEVSASFNDIVERLPQNIRKLFDGNMDTTIILYLGLCNGAGWVTELEDQTVILLGIEKIIELNWCDRRSLEALIFHEVGHVWHESIRHVDSPINNQRDASIMQLYQEGVAMRCEQIIYNDDNYYHQDKNNWLSWCLENEEDIKKEYLRRLVENQSIQDFFGDWCSYKGHSDVGYFLGCQFVRYLQRKYSLKEIANLSYPVLNIEFEIYMK